RGSPCGAWRAEGGAGGARGRSGRQLLAAGAEAPDAAGPRIQQQAPGGSARPREAHHQERPDDDLREAGRGVSRCGRRPGPGARPHLPARACGRAPRAGPRMMGHGPVEGVLVAARLLLAATFGLAAAAKLLDRSLAGGELESLGLPGPIARVARPAVPAAEIVTALLLALPVPGRWGGIAALVLLTVFTGFVAIQLIRGRTPDCRCFGQLSARPIGRATVARNLALAGV